MVNILLKKVGKGQTKTPTIDLIAENKA